LIPPALRFLLERNAGPIDGFILPGHASVVIGLTGYGFLEAEYGVPGVITGFEPLDILLAVRELLIQKASGLPGRVVNLYRRVVHDEGNVKAREILSRVIEENDVTWKGISVIPRSGLALREEFGRFDAARKLGLRGRADGIDVPPGCLCHGVILGEVEPEDCPLFGSACTPRSPAGPCMVSSEGTCRARHQYRAVKS